MIEKLVAWALQKQAVVLAVALALIAAGLYSYKVLDIEAYPNPVPPLVEIIAQPNGLGAEEVERTITIPLEIALAGMPGLKVTRSQSLFGLADVKCYFDWHTPYRDARQEVINRLGFVALPNGVLPTISPWNAIGEVLRYTLEGAGYSVMDLKTVQDWILRPQFRQAQGVIDVTSFGGDTKQYHVEVDPFRLRGHGVSLRELSSAIQNANQNVSGQRLTIGEQSYDVRGVGLLKDIHDVELVVMRSLDGTPTRVREVASTRIGPAPRLGQIGRDDHEDVVQGIVLMRYGEETPSTLEAIHARMREIDDGKLLPAGVRINTYYDRGNLIHVTMRTVLENVGIGIALVTLVLLLFLNNVRAALITALTIPLALFAAFCGLVGTGTSANLISIGAIDFGIVADSTVIMVESIFRHLGTHGQGTTAARVRNAASEVATPMTFSTVVIAVSFLPLFTLTGVSGVIFAPMARTYAFAIGGAFLVALTLTPVLAAKLLPADTQERESFVVRMLHRAYAPLVEHALRRPKRALWFLALPVFACGALFPLLGAEFMPKLEEGNIWIRATLQASISLEEATDYVRGMRRIVRGCSTDMEVSCERDKSRHPQIMAAVSQVGRPDDGTDVTGFNNIEIFAPLAPFDDRSWGGQTKEALIDALSKELRAAFPSANFNFSQMISDNVEEAVSGVKGENSLKVFGLDLEVNERVAERILAIMSRVRGVSDLGMFRSLGQPNVRITPDRAACARYGLNTGDVDAVIAAAIGGQVLTQVFEGERRFDLTVRWDPKYRQTIQDIREITVSTATGALVPLAQIAKVEFVDGPKTIYREGGRRYAPIKFSVRDRDLAGTIAEAQAKIAQEAQLPKGVHLVWSGEINELKEAQARLAIIIPITLLLITFLTYSGVKTWVDTAIVLLNVPVAATGGLLALVVTGTHLSVSAAMGFISVLGIAIQDGMLVVTYFQRLRGQGLGLEEAAREAAEKRFRPMLMTTLVAMLGLTPAALSHAIGSQTQRPLAIVVIGGSLILAVLIRVMQPPLLVVAHAWAERRRAGRRHAQQGAA